MLSTLVTDLSSNMELTHAKSVSAARRRVRFTISPRHSTENGAAGNYSVIVLMRDGSTRRQRFGAGLKHPVQVFNHDELPEHHLPMLRVGANVVIISDLVGRDQFQRLFLAGLNQLGRSQNLFTLRN